MENIPHQTITADFFDAWKSAIEIVISDAMPISEQKNIHFSLLRDHLNQPFIEHFSFRFGNHIFFCCIRTNESTGVGSTSTEYFCEYSKACGAIPCLIPLVRSPEGTWESYTPDCPLHFIDDEKELNPLVLSSIESKGLVGMTDWELLDWAVNVVVDHIMEKYGIQERNEINYQSTTGIYPQIWFRDQNESKKYVVVSAVRFPEKYAPKPENIDEICRSYPKGQGFFASVSFAQADGFEEPGLGYRPPAEFLYRGCGAYANFEGLEKL